MNIKSDLKLNKWKDFRYTLMEETNLTEFTVDDYYNKFIEDLKIASKNLSDNDAYELHEKLKKFFNKII